ncbi:hypothetical protein CMUS01_10877 [Colletotrichum musicola]|uniref:Uncharacterized protein n=1 Tax=Colletotrichum musicola TaxID=2175873 RepID=A0A8H6N858_9PEZI|nr:hypothetical protein CMUS01_10877 [Colletotrichum musicola]
MIFTAAFLALPCLRAAPVLAKDGSKLPLVRSLSRTNIAGVSFSHLNIEPPVLRRNDDPDCQIECGISCMPSDGVCCNTGGDYCDAGYECLERGCCPEGKTCTGCLKGEEECSDGCMPAGGVCCADGSGYCDAGETCNSNDTCSILGRDGSSPAISKSTRTAGPTAAHHSATGTLPERPTSTNGGVRERATGVGMIAAVVVAAWW